MLKYNTPISLLHSKIMTLDLRCTRSLQPVTCEKTQEMCISVLHAGEHCATFKGFVISQANLFRIISEVYEQKQLYLMSFECVL